MSSDGGGPNQRHRQRTLREHSYGGVCVRGDEVVTIVPRGKKALALPKGGRSAASPPSRRPRARYARRPG